MSRDGQEHQQFYHYSNVPFQAKSLVLVLMIALARMIGCLEGEKKENIPSSWLASLMSKVQCHFLAAGHKSSRSHIIMRSLRWRTPGVCPTSLAK